jgi:hypothetical protein
VAQRRGKSSCGSARGPGICSTHDYSDGLQPFAQRNPFFRSTALLDSRIGLLWANFCLLCWHAYQEFWAGRLRHVLKSLQPSLFLLLSNEAGFVAKLWYNHVRVEYT